MASLMRAAGWLGPTAVASAAMRRGSHVASDTTRASLASKTASPSPSPSPSGSATFAAASSAARGAVRRRARPVRSATAPSSPNVGGFTIANERSVRVATSDGGEAAVEAQKTEEPPRKDEEPAAPKKKRRNNRRSRGGRGPNAKAKEGQASTNLNAVAELITPAPTDPTTTVGTITGTITGIDTAPTAAATAANTASKTNNGGKKRGNATKPKPKSKSGPTAAVATAAPAVAAAKKANAKRNTNPNIITPTLAAATAAAAVATKKKNQAKKKKARLSAGGAVSIPRAASEPVVSGAGAAKFMGTIDFDDEDSLDIAEPPTPKAGTAKFMGTIDFSDDEEDIRTMRSLAARPDPNAVFMGTIDDGDMNLFNDAPSSADFADASAAAAAVVAPPVDGNPGLAFLYDPQALASITSEASKTSKTSKFQEMFQVSASFEGSEEAAVPGPNSEVAGVGIGVNAPAVVGRCNALLRRCVTMDAVLGLVREMTYAGITPAESTYFAVMLVCRNSAVGPGRAIEVYDAMRLNGVSVSKRTFDLVMECTLRASQVRDAIRLKEDMQADNIPIGAKLFTSLLRSLADNDVGRRKGAKYRLIRTCKLFEEMLASGVTPHPASFNSLIVAAQRARQPDLVARTFEEMVATGVSPSRETYESALSAVSAGGLVDTALDIFGAMRRDGFEPRKSTYNSLLEACATAPQPRVEQAFEIFYRMTGEGKVVPNRRTFALLIDAAVRAGLPSFAFDAFDAMREVGVEVTLSTYNRLIRAAGMKPDGVPTALALFEEIKARSDVAPDEYTYGTLLAACAQAGDAKTAQALVVEMEEAGVPHNQVTRHAYIMSLGRTDKWQDALLQYHCLQEAVQGGASVAGAGAGTGSAVGTSRETYNLLFDALLGSGGAEAAIASVALDKGGGDAFIHGERAAAARSVFRDGINAGVYDEPINGLDTEDAVSVDLDIDGEQVGAAVEVERGPSKTPLRPLRVSFMSMTRAEAIVATLVLLESFSVRAATETEAEAGLPSGLFIGAGPGTKGNAQRRMLAVESVLRAASLPCETVDDPRTYVIGVTRANLRAWSRKHCGSFTPAPAPVVAAAL